MKPALPWWAYDVTTARKSDGLAIRFRVRRLYLAWLGLRAIAATVLPILSRKVFGR